MAKNTVNGKAPNKGELKQIGNFLKEYLPKLTVDQFLKVVNPCCRPVILTATARCSQGGHDIDITFSNSSFAGLGGAFLTIKGAGIGWLYMNCDDETGVCTVPNIPYLTPGPQEIVLVITYAPIPGQGSPEVDGYGGFLIASKPFNVDIPECGV